MRQCSTHNTCGTMGMRLSPCCSIKQSLTSQFFSNCNRCELKDCFVLHENLSFLCSRYLTNNLSEGKKLRLCACYHNKWPNSNVIRKLNCLFIKFLSKLLKIMWELENIKLTTTEKLHCSLGLDVNRALNDRCISLSCSFVWTCWYLVTCACFLDRIVMWLTGFFSLVTFSSSMFFVKRPVTKRFRLNGGHVIKQFF